MSTTKEAVKTGELPCEPQKCAPYKLDWYQTETHIVVNILAKNLISDEIKVSFSESHLNLALAFKDETSVSKTIELERKIIPERCSYKILPTKVELRLAKSEQFQWPRLEKEEGKMVKKPQVRNWDKVVNEFEEDKEEGEAVLNSLFQKIYAEGSDEVKKAMNKSFLESGGTELNTNWDAVSKGKVSIKPPEGLEWKSWDT